MSVKQIMDIEVECPNGHRVQIPKEVWEHEIVEVDEKSEHGMGNEIHHQYSVDGYSCPQCEKGIVARVDVWEYPEGTIETTDSSSNVVGNFGDSFTSHLN